MRLSELQLLLSQASVAPAPTRRIRSAPPQLQQASGRGTPFGTVPPLHRQDEVRLQQTGIVGKFVPGRVFKKFSCQITDTGPHVRVRCSAGSGGLCDPAHQRHLGHTC